MRNCGRYWRALVPTAVAAAAVALIFGSAPAALAAACPPPPSVVNPFLPWGDGLDYVPVTDGSFEPIAKGSKDRPWSLTGNAAIVSDNEPWYIDGDSSDNSALLLQEGDQATSACTTAPQIASTVRFFVQNVGSATGRLHVEILVNGGKNGVLDGGDISAGPTWQPSDVIVLPWAQPLKGAVDLRVRLTPEGAGAAFEVDDVYIDPCRGR